MGHLPVVCFRLLFLLFSVSHLTDTGFCAAAGNEQFVFSGFDGADSAAAGGANLTLDGAATVSSSGLLELTNNGVNVKGHAFYPTPFQFIKESPNGTARSFSATFVFAVISEYRDISTDGMAFVVSPTRDLRDASAAQYMGFLDAAAMTRTFAVELDTVQNVEMRDVDGNHVAVDVAGRYSRASRAAGFYDDDGVFHELVLHSGEATQVWVDYDGQTHQVNVTLAPVVNTRTKPSKPLISDIIVPDLSSVLTEQAYVGFSAGTGPIKSRHCVLAWSFAVDGPAPPIDYSKMPKLPSSDDDDRNKKTTTLRIALPVLAASALIILLVAAILLVIRKRAYDDAEVREDWEVEFGPHRFSYKDLFNATEGFKSKNILGVGGFGTVYKGVLPKSKSEVAVKRVSHDSSQGIREFVSEVVSIGHLRHRNLVQLLGYCRRKGELLLVYDYMANGSLDKYLYEEGEEKPVAVLEWEQRFGIIKDVASALFYLHEKWDKVVVHRDVKASNVLLDRGMTAHLGDFGLARLYDHHHHHDVNLQQQQVQTTRVVGTTGYMAPELARSGKASPLTDVFAFGTFLLEVVCGRRPVCTSARDGRTLMLVDRVLEYWHAGKLLDTVDPRMMRGDDDDRFELEEQEARMVLTLGLMCSHPFPSARPTMRQVMQYLDGDAPLPELTPANLTLLSMMQGEEAGMSSFDDQSVLQYPWSGTSVATVTPDLSVGR